MELQFPDQVTPVHLLLTLVEVEAATAVAMEVVEAPGDPPPAMEPPLEAMMMAVL